MTLLHEENKLQKILRLRKYDTTKLMWIPLYCNNGGGTV